MSPHWKIAGPARPKRAARPTKDLDPGAPRYARATPPVIGGRPRLEPIRRAPGERSAVYVLAGVRVGQGPCPGLDPLP